MNTKIIEMPEDDHMLLRVRVAFLQKATTLHAWCIANNIDPAGAHRALTGKWAGPKATMLAQKIIAAAGIAEK